MLTKVNVIFIHVTFLSYCNHQIISSLTFDVGDILNQIPNSSYHLLLILSLLLLLEWW